jgi:hypothetical protein
MALTERRRDGHDLLRVVERRFEMQKGRCWISRRTFEDHGLIGYAAITTWAAQNGLSVQAPMIADAGYELSRVAVEQTTE